jgi:capsid protein
MNPKARQMAKYALLLLVAASSAIWSILGFVQDRVALHRRNVAGEGGTSAVLPLLREAGQPAVCLLKSG